MVVRLTGVTRKKKLFLCSKKRGEEEARLEEYSINYQGKGKTETASCTCSLRASTWNATRAAQSSDVSPTLLFSAVATGFPDWGVLVLALRGRCGTVKSTEPTVTVLLHFFPPAGGESQCPLGRYYCFFVFVFSDSAP
jgi:hypothetical protein